MTNDLLKDTEKDSIKKSTLIYLSGIEMNEKEDYLMDEIIEACNSIEEIIFMED